MPSNTVSVSDPGAIGCQRGAAGVNPPPPHLALRSLLFLHRHQRKVTRHRDDQDLQHRLAWYRACRCQELVAENRHLRSAAPRQQPLGAHR